MHKGRLLAIATPLSPYKVLATKYRPQTFSDMIGQDVLVQTLGNAITFNRIANAFLLTGIRGVGKTTTARIIARALNCTGNDGQSGPTIHPCGTCANCTAIGQSRHPDILEVDAASRTGVDDMREIIENIAYAPSMARYKIYIIDEVHMLSKSAFNALLKTLEEPPAHVKFIFATTEIRKIPITILSRCQRFDLKRISGEILQQYLRVVVDKEEVKADDESLSLIAKAAEGSVRDALSLLDQAIVHSNHAITADIVTQMMGIGNRYQSIELFSYIAAGQTEKALELLNIIYTHGTDMTQLFQDLLELIHLITKAKAIPTLTAPSYLTSEHYTEVKNLAERLEMSYLTRCWQMVVQGLEEIAKAPVDLIAGEMLVIKLCYMSSLPSPTKVIRQLQEQTNHIAAAAPVEQHISSSPVLMSKNSSLAPASHPVIESVRELIPIPQNFEAVVALFKEKGEILLYSWLYNDASLVSFKPGHLDIHLPNSVPGNITQRLQECLHRWTAMRWIIAISRQAGDPSLAKQSQIKKQALKEQLTKHPQVAKILELFPGSYISQVMPNVQTGE